MKRILAVFTVALVFTACANEADSDTFPDTVNSTIAPDNTINADTMNRVGDTSSYERMQQKNADSLPR
jgi:hypothetical protein